MSGVTVKVEGASTNISPMAFAVWSMQFMACYDAIRNNSEFSPIPYFLLCRAIELGLKAMHLRNSTRTQVKHRFGHKISAAYEDLKNSDKILTTDELTSLRVASPIYAGKGFEYFMPEHALRGYSEFPAIADLASAARKICTHATSVCVCE